MCRVTFFIELSTLKEWEDINSWSLSTWRRVTWGGRRESQHIGTIYARLQYARKLNGSHNYCICMWKGSFIEINVKNYHLSMQFPSALQSLSVHCFGFSDPQLCCFCFTLTALIVSFLAAAENAFRLNCSQPVDRCMQPVTRTCKQCLARDPKPKNWEPLVQLSEFNCQLFSLRNCLIWFKWVLKMLLYLVSNCVILHYGRDIVDVRVGSEYC